MIKVILGILGVAHLKPFPSADGFTLRKTDGTELLITSANGKTRKELLITSANGKTRKQQAHLLSDDEVDELAVLLGIGLNFFISGTLVLVMPGTLKPLPARFIQP